MNRDLGSWAGRSDNRRTPRASATVRRLRFSFASSTRPIALLPIPLYARSCDEASSEDKAAVRRRGVRTVLSPSCRLVAPFSGREE